MAIIKCKMCGGDLEIASGASVAECEYCGTKQTLPKVNDEVIQNLFNRANNLRIKCEFDKAEQIYEKILQENDAESEAHWGIVLCKYGIEYVEDPKTFKRVPTCHRTSYDAVTTDADYLAAVEHADDTQRSIYEAEAKAIDEIQKNILNIVKNEKPFDVFICYKETDEEGKRTIDSTIANDVYYQLTQEGLKVFYAAITLEDKLGQEYEPYIFAALNSAKVMLVIGTKPQYFSAVWVKNEWSRFLKLMKADRSKLLIPCYKDMDAYDLPEEFAHLQAQDMSKIGFINDIVRGIRKVASKGETQIAAEKEAVVAIGNANTVPLLKRAFMFLEDGDWNSADEYCEKVLDIDPECAEAYLGKLLAELRVHNLKALKDCSYLFDNNKNYLKLVRFADDELKTELTDYLEQIKIHHEKERVEKVYNQASVLRAKAATDTNKRENNYRKAADLYGTICDYKNAAELRTDCLAKAEGVEKDRVLAEGTARMAGKTVSDYQAAIKIFETIAGWKDADQRKQTCYKRIEEIKNREQLYAKRQAERAKMLEEEQAKRKKKLQLYLRLAVSAVGIVLLTVALVIFVINPLKEKNAYIKIHGQEAYDRYGILKPGSTITLGAYEQDNDQSNGKENIEWIVLDIQGEKMLVISKYALDLYVYNEKMSATTWETCTMRQWLNDTFFSEAFSDAETQKIITTPILVENSGIKEVQDRMFLLSKVELNTHSDILGTLDCKPTDRVKSFSPEMDLQGNTPWWLRSTGDGPGSAKCVGSGILRDESINLYYGVRPAMWIVLKK